MENEHYAADWLHSHEAVSGTMFHNYLLNRSGGKKEPEMTLLIGVIPDYPLLPVKIIREED